MSSRQPLHTEAQLQGSCCGKSEHGHSPTKSVHFVRIWSIWKTKLNKTKHQALKSYPAVMLTEEAWRNTLPLLKQHNPDRQLSPSDPAMNTDSTAQTDAVFQASTARGGEFLVEEHTVPYMEEVLDLSRFMWHWPHIWNSSEGKSSPTTRASQEIPQNWRSTTIYFSNKICILKASKSHHNLERKL